MKNRRFIAGIISSLVFLAIPTTPSWALGDRTAISKYSVNLDLAPRQQWNSNYGYCGETSFISAGMYYGQYTSQWTARSLASPGQSQLDQESQLLLGVNDLDAAESMKLQAVAFDSESAQSTPSFLTWVKSMIINGRPVIIGVFDNMKVFEEPLPGDSEYDHIVPVLGFGSQSPLVASDRKYRSSDVISFSDNGLSDIGEKSYLQRTRLSDFQRSRSQANTMSAPLYSMRNRPMNYATAVTGVADPSKVTIPVRLTSSSNGEGEQNLDELASPPAPMPITLTATVSIPDPRQAYNVYLYDDFSKVPTKNFNASAANAIQGWTIPAGAGSSWSQTVNLMSNQTRVFRAVPTTAP